MHTKYIYKYRMRLHCLHPFAWNWRFRFQDKAKNASWSRRFLPSTPAKIAFLFQCNALWEYYFFKIYFSVEFIYTFTKGKVINIVHIMEWPQLLETLSILLLPYIFLRHLLEHIQLTLIWYFLFSFF